MCVYSILKDGPTSSECCLRPVFQLHLQQTVPTLYWATVSGWCNMLNTLSMWGGKGCWCNSGEYHGALGYSVIYLTCSRFQMYHCQFTMDCCWVHLLLWLGGSARPCKWWEVMNSWLRVPSSTSSLSLQGTVRVPRAVFQKVIWPYSRISGVCTFILTLIGFVRSTSPSNRSACICSLDVQWCLSCFGAHSKMAVFYVTKYMGPSTTPKFGIWYLQNPIAIN